jgi:hypothetical protein
LIQALGVVAASSCWWLMYSVERWDGKKLGVGTAQNTFHVFFSDYRFAILLCTID